MGRERILYERGRSRRSRPWSTTRSPSGTSCTSGSARRRRWWWACSTSSCCWAWAAGRCPGGREGGRTGGEEPRRAPLRVTAVERRWEGDELPWCGPSSTPATGEAPCTKLPSRPPVPPRCPAGGSTPSRRSVRGLRRGHRPAKSGSPVYERSTRVLQEIYRKVYKDHEGVYKNGHLTDKKWPPDRHTNRFAPVIVEVLQQARGELLARGGRSLAPPPP